MNIYFVNKKSNIKGPFDITDTNHQKIIKIGDVIIRDYDNCILFLLVISNTNKWNTCLCPEKAIGNLGLEGNTLLYSFDGIKRRFGDIQSIAKLLELFNTPLINNFFENILSILEYKCDFFDATIFFKLHLSTPFELPEVNSNITNNKKALKTNTYIFESYLTQDMLSLFHLLFNQDMPLREIYNSIRENYPKDFREAIKAFLNDFPDNTIYDKNML